MNEEIADELDLTETEYNTVNYTLHDTLNQLEEIREQSVEVRQRSENQLFVKIPSFSEEGEVLKHSMEASLREQLGDDRHDSFLELAGENLDEEYYHFGKAYETVSFKSYESKATGDIMIRVVEQLHLPQGNGTKTIVQTKGNYNEVPDVYQSLIDWSP